MARILVYTSPARGHLFPILGPALELHGRGHQVHVRTLASDVETVRSYGLAAEPIATQVEEREMDDWRARNPMEALELALRTFGDRARGEVADMREAIEATNADLLVVDTNSWGAQAVAEASGLPWTTFQPYFTSLPAPGVPPFGPGFARATGIGGRIRDGLFGRMIYGKMAKTALPSINAVRTEVGLKPLADMGGLFAAPQRIIYFTTEALEYPRDRWPENFRFVGPGTWAPASASPDWLAGVDSPIALVTCSTERQGDRGIIETALRALPGSELFVVATTAAHAADDLAQPSGSQYRVEQFVPHDPLIDRASVVVCHGGMGITQRALAKGVPVVVVPFGRDQLEVARRVEYSRAGVCLMPKHLSEESLKSAVATARKMTEGARRIEAESAAAGGAPAAADVVEELLGTPHAEAEAR